jgi:hypothetical protein
MITKTYFMKQFIEPLEEKFGALATTIPEQRIEYIRHYYALLKYHPNVGIVISDILEKDILTTPYDLVMAINEEGK